MGHAGRTSVSGIAEVNGVLGTYGKEALTDTLEVAQKALQAKSLKEVVDLQVGYVTRRSQAVFSSVNEVNIIAQSKTVAAWAPLGETLRSAGEKAAA